MTVLRSAVVDLTLRADWPADALNDGSGCYLSTRARKVGCLFRYRAADSGDIGHRLAIVSGRAGGIRLASEEKHQRTTTKELWENKCSHGHLICFVKKESLSGNTDMIRTGQNGRRQNSMRFLATLCVFLFSSCVSSA